MTEKKKPTKKAVEAVVSEETVNMVDNTTEALNLVREAYTAFENGITHLPYTVRLKSGVYFKTVNLVKDIKTVWADATISDKAVDNTYAITSGEEVIDYIVEIIQK